MNELYFKICYTHLCWGIKESSLSGEYEQKISVNEGENFTLKYQVASVFTFENEGQPKLKLRKKYGDGFVDAAEFIINENGETAIEFDDDYERFGDCNTGEFKGVVILK